MGALSACSTTQFIYRPGLFFGAKFYIFSDSSTWRENVVQSVVLLAVLNEEN